jgi:aryl-alcohol dehydrogenase-like predicted oxidoreductase
MRYRPLGRTGLEVSTVSLGSWLTFGSVGEETATACVRRAFELGVTLFDTANVYDRGGAEEVLGRALAPLDRDRYLVATKVYSALEPDRSDEGLGRRNVLRHCEASLRRLGVDAIDLYQCHRFDPHTPVEETCRAMDELVREGKVRHWGVSKWTADQIDACVTLCSSAGLVPPAADQPGYSLLDPGIEADVLPACGRLGLGVLVFSPLAEGMLTGKYASPRDLPAASRAAGPRGEAFARRQFTRERFERVGELRELAGEVGLPMARLALAWVLRRSEVSTAIVGATNVGHVEANLAAADVDLDPATLGRLDAIARSARSQRTPARRWPRRRRGEGPGG